MASDLSLNESRQILTQLALLRAPQHTSSKLVICEKEVWLEDNTGWGIGSVRRTVAEYGNYIVGHQVSRDLKSLKFLMERVFAAFTARMEEIDPQEDKRLLREATEGLLALKGNQYSNNSVKNTVKVEMIEDSVKVLESTKLKVEEKQSVLNFYAQQRDKTAYDQLLAEKDQQIRQLTEQASRFADGVTKLAANRVLQGKDLEKMDDLELVLIIKRSTEELFNRAQIAKASQGRS